MTMQIEVPDRLLNALENPARHLRSSIEAAAIEAIERDLARGEPESRVGTAPRVSLPLIHSARPGALRSLTNAEIDGILDQ